MGQILQKEKEIRVKTSQKYKIKIDYVVVLRVLCTYIFVLGFSLRLLNFHFILES